MAQMDNQAGAKCEADAAMAKATVASAETAHTCLWHPQPPLKPFDGPGPLSCRRQILADGGAAPAPAHRPSPMTMQEAGCRVRRRGSRRRCTQGCTHRTGCLSLAPFLPHLPPARHHTGRRTSQLQALVGLGLWGLCVSGILQKLASPLVFLCLCCDGTRECTTCTYLLGIRCWVDAGLASSRCNLFLLVLLVKW